jgi:thymidylate synthase ThyX
MVRVISPKVNVVSYGPELKLRRKRKLSANPFNWFKQDEVTITPDEFVYGASGITYKGMGSIDELRRMKLEDEEFSTKLQKSIIKSAGAGHASLATTPGFWMIMEGNSSKLVDSIFTGAVFSSSLMPSGRRVPISKEEILVPKGIHESGKDAEEIYLKVLNETIQAYEDLQTKGVPKQEASKIVPYGHSGGGFAFMPLETLVYFSRLAERNPLAMPEEGKEIIDQLENFIHKHGMGITYESRKEAPRTSCVNPNIFTFEKTFAEEQFEKDSERIYAGPKLISLRDIPSEERTKRIEQYFKNKKEMLKFVGDEWKESLSELEGIVTDFNDSVRVALIDSISWRVWGEVKRHRTLSQTPQSVYNAVRDLIKKENYILDKACSIPESVKNNAENLEIWRKTFSDSIHAYKDLVKGGIKESDAVALIPRGLRLAVVKDLDLYSMTTGFMSLRLCNTCEPEMRRTTERERDLICSLSIDGVSSPEESPVKRLIVPKCQYGGFCPESDYKTCCGKVKQVVPNYNEEMHKAIWRIRTNNIIERIIAKK